MHYLTLFNLQAKTPPVYFVFNIISTSPWFCNSLIHFYISNLLEEEHLEKS